MNDDLPLRQASAPPPHGRRPVRGAALRISGSFLAVLGFLCVIASIPEGYKLSGPGLVPDLEEQRALEMAERVLELQKELDELRRQYPGMMPPADRPPGTEVSAQAHPRRERPEWPLPVGIALLASGASLCWWGRRERWPVFDGLDALRAAESGRGLILFLRPFSTDGVQDHPGLDLYNRSPTPGSDEEKVAGVLFRYGDVVTVGKPGERLPEIGGYRLYLDDGSWQDVVAQLIREARLLVLRVGNSAGLEWELDAILASDRLAETIFILSHGEMANAEFSSRIAESLGVELGAPDPPRGCVATMLVVVDRKAVWFYRERRESLYLPTVQALKVIGLQPVSAATATGRQLEAGLKEAWLTCFAVTAASWLFLLFSPLFMSHESIDLWGDTIVMFSVGFFILGFIMFFAGGNDPDA